MGARLIASVSGPCDISKALGDFMEGGFVGGEKVSSSNAISLAAAAIGIVSGVASGALGYEHAKSAWQAATGGTAGLSGYVDVGQAFWDAVPIAASVALVVGLLAAGQVVNPGILRFGAGIFGVLVLALASQYDPNHLAVYQRTVASGESDTLGLLQLWMTAYGPLAGVLACIAGIGVGYAVGSELAKP